MGVHVVLPSIVSCHDDSHLTDNVDKITQYLTEGAGKGQSYDKLAEFTDKWGPRISGDAVLEHSIGLYCTLYSCGQTF